MVSKPQANPEYLNIAEVAKLVRLGRRTVYEMCRTARMPGAAKVGNKWRVRRATLLAWLKARGEAGDEAEPREASKSAATRRGAR